MNINKIQAAVDKNNEIKAIDHMIRQIDQLAKLIVNKDVKTHWEFKVEDLMGIEKEESKIYFDGDGDMRKLGFDNSTYASPIWQNIMKGAYQTQAESKPANKHIHSFSESELARYNELKTLLKQPIKQ